MNRLRVLIVGFAALPALLPGAPASGQTTLGVTAAMNTASASASEPNEALGSVKRAAVGLSAGFPVSEGWRVQLGAAYAQKGFGFGPVEFGIDYIEFTGLLDRPFPVGGRTTVHVLAGPALGIRTSCKTTVSVRGEKRSQDCEGTVLKDFDFGVAGGAEAEIGVSDGLALSAGALYTLGLLDVDDGDESMKNRTVTLRVGVVFPVG